jgi:RNA-binding protein
MTSKQRAYLKGIANNTESIFQVGKLGVSDILIKQLNDAIEARELIKIHVLETVPDDIKSVANEIAERTNSELVQIVGSKVTLFRQKKEKSKFDLPK